jgi:hypothetical protein
MVKSLLLGKSFNICKLPKLTMNSDLMRRFFAKSLEGIIRLIEEQIQSITNKGRSTKNILLIGGFAESPYLKDQLMISFETLRRIGLQIPETSWTAVVRGAAICGVENLGSRMTTLTAWKRFYGVSVSENYSIINHSGSQQAPTIQNLRNGQKLVLGRMMWLIRKGDIVSSEITHNFTVNFFSNQERSGYLSIYAYGDDDDAYNFDDEPPEALDGRENGKTHLKLHMISTYNALEVKPIGKMKWDLDRFDLSNFQRIQPGAKKISKSAGAGYCAPCQLKTILRNTNLEFQIVWKNQPIGSTSVRYI